MSGLRYLPRLERHFYQAFAVVFWTHTIEDRATGWLNDSFHRDFRELLVHAGAREGLFCPAYCLMPDHFHVVWMGMRLESDQINGSQFLRKQVNRLLAGEEIVERSSRGSGSRGSEAAADPPNLSGPRGKDQPQAHACGYRIRLQHQPHDHVLREEERRRDAFAKTCFYTFENPVRKSLVVRAPDWRYSGAILPGYPTLWPFLEDYWPLFWKLYEKHREPEPKDPPKPPPSSS